ncbi:hypothetical protein F5B18DRAFT_635222 [Nemania serpens]|nr:hypothetical protein F5B18DRAFT_635222 [Nemania serpens]
MILSVISERFGTPLAVLKEQYSKVLLRKTANACSDGKTSFGYREDRFRTLLGHFSMRYDSQFMKRPLESYEAMLVASLELKCGALGLLSTLKHMGKKIAVITEGPQDAQERTVDALGIKSYIDCLATTSEYPSSTVCSPKCWNT